MATVRNENVNTKLYELWLGNRHRPTLSSHFSESDLETMFKDDLSAGRSVPLLLTAAIFFGMVFGILAVMLIC